MSTSQQRAPGRPAVGKKLWVRYPEDDIAFAKEFAERYTNGNVNEAFRQIVACGRAMLEEQRAEQASAA